MYYCLENDSKFKVNNNNLTLIYYCKFQHEYNNTYNSI